MNRIHWEAVGKVLIVVGVVPMARVLADGWDVSNADADVFGIGSGLVVAGALIAHSAIRRR